MKTKRTLAIALSLIMVFSLFCIIPTVSAEEAEASAAAYESFNNDIFTTGSKDIYSLNDSENLTGMKYFYLYVKATGVDGPVVGIQETAAGGSGRYFAKTDATTINAVKLDGTPVSWTNGGGNQLKLPSGGFEGYVILNVADNLYAGWSDNISGLDTANIDFIRLEGLNTATAIGDFGFARSYSDAVNAVIGNLKKYYSENVTPLSTYTKTAAPTGELEINVYQDEAHTYTDKKWVGFYLKSEDWFQFNLALVENNGAWWWLSDQQRKYYYLKSDGTMQEINLAAGSASHGINTYFANAGAFDGYVIFNTDDSIVDTHPGYTGGNDTELTLDNLKSVKLFSFSTGGNFGDTFTIGNVALGTSADELKAYYLAEESKASAYTLNPISTTVTSGNRINNLSFEDLFESNSDYIGFYLNAGEAGNIEFLFHEKQSAGEGAYWTTIGQTAFVSKDGTITKITNGGNGWLNSIPTNFDGYVLMNSATFTSHPGYTDSADGFDISNIDNLEVVNSDKAITIQYLSIGENPEALLEHLKAEAEGTHFENASLVNENIFERVQEQPGETEFFKIKSNNYFENSNAAMNYVAFRFDNAVAGGTINFGLIEENGSMYSIDNGNPYYILTDSYGMHTQTALGKGEVRFIVDGGSTLKSGYVIVPLTSIGIHSGEDDNGVFDSENISKIQIWNNFDCDKSVGKFAFGVSTNDAIDCIANADIENSTIIGDATGDRNVNILDLVRMKKYHADNTVEVSYNSLDVNGDGEISALDIAALRRQLLLS